MAVWLSLCQVAQADDLAQRIDDIRTQLSPKVDPDVTAALAKLFEAVPCDAKASSQPDNTLCQQKALEALFKKILDSAANDADRKKLQDEILKSFLDSDVLLDTDLKKTLAIALAPPARIHIVAAYYGHLDDIVYALKNFRTAADHNVPKPKARPKAPEPPRLFSDLNEHSYISDRLCPATRTVRALCQGQTVCGFEAAATFSGQTLCGFEPAPYAEARMKGLVVRYRCNSDRNWRPETGLYDETDNKIPVGPDPEPSEKSNPLTGAPQWALLRPGEVTKIICALPLEASAKTDK